MITGFERTRNDDVVIPAKVLFPALDNCYLAMAVARALNTRKPTPILLPHERWVAAKERKAS